MTEPLLKNPVRKCPYCCKPFTIYWDYIAHVQNHAEGEQDRLQKQWEEQQNAPRK